MDLFITNYTKKEVLISVAVASAIVIAGYFLLPSNNEIICQDLQSKNYHSVNGIVEDKYIDEEEHLNKIVELKSLDPSERASEILSLTLDTSGLYETIKVGDTLKNDIWSIDFYINSDTTIRLNYGVDCTEFLKSN
jgi:hypothetical protein